MKLKISGAVLATLQFAAVQESGTQKEGGGRVPRITPEWRTLRRSVICKARFRTEPPFASSSESDVWQYGERIYKAREEISTREWPHPTFFPLNYSAKRVLEFFSLQMKSRMQRSPWAGDRLRLDNGLTGNAVTSATLPQLQPMNPRPAA